MPWASLCPSLNIARVLFLMRAQCLSCPQLRKVCFAVPLLSGVARSSLPARSASPSAIYCARFLFCDYFQIGIFIYRSANYRQSPRLRLLPFTFAFSLVGSSARGVAFLCPAGGGLAPLVPRFRLSCLQPGRGERSGAMCARAFLNGCRRAAPLFKKCKNRLL